MRPLPSTASEHGPATGPKVPTWLRDYPAFLPVVVGYALWRVGLNYLYTREAGHVWQWGTQGIQFFSLFMPMLLLGPLVFWTAHRFRMDGRPRWPVVAAHGVSLAAFCGLSFGMYLLLHTALSNPAQGWGPHLRRLLRTEPLFIASLGWIFFLAGAAIAHARTFMREARWRAAREARLEAQLAQAQLQQLKSQLQPHFLFNTHSAISSLMTTDVAAARRMLNLLSDFLRMSLQDSGQQVVPLRRELAFTDLYLEIQQLRFTDHLRVERQVDPGLLDWPVPHMLLQPLVENALKHGIGPRIEPGTLRISARQDADGLVLLVEDDGVGPQAASRRGPGEGFGLRNAKERLLQLYGEAATLAWGARDGGGFSVAARIPEPSAMMPLESAQP